MEIMAPTRITPKNKWRADNYKQTWEQSFLHAARLANLIYILTKYYENSQGQSELWND